MNQLIRFASAAIFSLASLQAFAEGTPLAIAHGVQPGIEHHGPLGSLLDCSIAEEGNVVHVGKMTQQQDGGFVGHGLVQTQVKCMNMGAYPLPVTFDFDAPSFGVAGQKLFTAVSLEPAQWVTTYLHFDGPGVQEMRVAETNRLAAPVYVTVRSATMAGSVRLAGQPQVDVDYPSPGPRLGDLSGPTVEQTRAAALSTKLKSLEHHPHAAQTGASGASATAAETEAH